MVFILLPSISQKLSYDPQIKVQKKIAIVKQVWEMPHTVPTEEIHNAH